MSLGENEMLAECIEKVKQQVAQARRNAISVSVGVMGFSLLFYYCNLPDTFTEE